MATRNMSTNTQSRQSMATSGSAVKARQLVHTPTPFMTDLLPHFSTPPGPVEPGIDGRVTAPSHGSGPDSGDITCTLDTKGKGHGAAKRTPVSDTHISIQAHLHSQLAQLTTNLQETENLLKMTSIQ